MDNALSGVLIVASIVGMCSLITIASMLVSMHSAVLRLSSEMAHQARLLGRIANALENRR